MPNLFISPHSDDEALFGSYIIQRSGADVLVVTDGQQHHRKFDLLPGIRRDESKEACKILGVKVEFLGLSDEYGQIEKIDLFRKFSDYKDHVAEQLVQHDV